ncbi:MAG: hypothetical protein IPP33_03620 [Flavobacteriales bacterium]|nr:hypothetical protein [Flavobacteriales bacterium]
MHELNKSRDPRALQIEKPITKHLEHATEPLHSLCLSRHVHGNGLGYLLGALCSNERRSHPGMMPLRMNPSTPSRRITFTENQGRSPKACCTVQISAGADWPRLREVHEELSFYPIAARERQEEGMRIEQDTTMAKPSRPLTRRERGHGGMMSFKNAASAMRVESRASHTEPPTTSSVASPR